MGRVARFGGVCSESITTVRKRTSIEDFSGWGDERAGTGRIRRIGATIDEFAKCAVVLAFLLALELRKALEDLVESCARQHRFEFGLSKLLPAMVFGLGNAICEQQNPIAGSQCAESRSVMDAGKKTDHEIALLEPDCSR